jgi:negative regulator of flagellin synthesis FlgM
MPININNLNNSTQAKIASENKHVKIVHSNSNNITARTDSNTASLSPDSVNLTGTALRVKSLEDQIERLPIVDIKKVEQIQNAINDGSFEFNPERIAEKMIKFEKDLL